MVERGRNPASADPGLTDRAVLPPESVCAGCMRGPEAITLTRDHDHSTGHMRGVLCRGCNLALGHALDDPAVLRRLAAYAEGAGGVPGG